MEIYSRLEKLIADPGVNLPWPYGFDPKTGSEEARAVWHLLTEVERLAISRHNPFKLERDKAISVVRASGVSWATLVQLTGFSWSSLFRIVRPIQMKRRKNNRE